jgi:hypothetical protein
MTAVAKDRLHGTLDALVLKSLASGPRHGYAIARWLEDTTQNAIRVEEGSLYPALYRMEKRGWLEAEWGMSELGPVTFGKKEEAIFLGREFAQHQDFSEATAVEIDREVKRILDRAYAHAKEIITQHKSSLDRIARKLLERETLEGWEVNDILREETGNDYLKMKEYYPETSPGETMTIAPGSGPSTDVSTPVAQPPVQTPTPDRAS